MNLSKTTSAGRRGRLLRRNAIASWQRWASDGNLHSTNGSRRFSMRCCHEWHMKYHFPLLLVLAIAGCNQPAENPPVSEQPQEQSQVAQPPSPTPKQTPAPTASTNCDRAYPDVCVPPPPPDLDCKDIPHQNFRVLTPDPHKFDGKDQDGVGCESNR